MIDNEEYFNEDLVDNLLDEDEITTDTGELYEHFRMVVDSGQGSVRIDKFLFERMPNSSRNRIQKALVHSGQAVKLAILVEQKEPYVE